MSNSIYELDLFGFTALQQTLERRLAIKKILNTALDRLIEKTSTGLAEKTAQELNLQKPGIIKSMLLSFEDDLKDLEAMDHKLFTVPGHVLLEWDSVLLRPKEDTYTPEYESMLDEELLELDRLYFENCVFYSLLEAGIATFELVKPFIDDQIDTAAGLEQCLELTDCANITALKNETITLLDKM